MLVDIHGKIKSLFFVHLFYDISNGIFVSLFNCFFVHVLTVSYVYKTLKMPAH